MILIPKKKKWSLNRSIGLDYLEDEDGRIVLIAGDNATIEDLKIARFAPDALRLIQSFVENVNSGNYKPRTTVKEFEKLLEKFNE